MKDSEWAFPPYVVPKLALAVGRAFQARNAGQLTIQEFERLVEGALREAIRALWADFLNRRMHRSRASPHRKGVRQPDGSRRPRHPHALR